MSDKSYIPKKKPVKSLKKFINYLEESGNITNSSKLARVSKGTVYHFKEVDETFRMEWETAMERWSDKMEGEAFALIKKQFKEKDYKSNPALLIFLLKGAKPNKYQEHVQQDTTAMKFIEEIKTFAQAEKQEKEKKIKKSPSNKTSKAMNEANRILKDKGIE
tara:strand:- start:347 stop:832 length:486 start_codon:yes stop_codon:yes gene_type:complete